MYTGIHIGEQARLCAAESPRGHPPVGRPRPGCTALELRSSGLTYRKLVYVFSNYYQKHSNGTDTRPRENRETIPPDLCTLRPCRGFYVARAFPPTN